MSPVWTSHVLYMNEWCHTWPESLHKPACRQSHVTRVNESCHTCEWVMSHVWMSHVARLNESCHTWERVMSRTWLSHTTHLRFSTTQSPRQALRTKQHKSKKNGFTPGSSEGKKKALHIWDYHQHSQRWRLVLWPKKEFRKKKKTSHTWDSQQRSRHDDWHCALPWQPPNRHLADPLSPPQNCMCVVGDSLLLHVRYVCGMWLHVCHMWLARWVPRKTTHVW